MIGMLSPVMKQVVDEEKNYPSPSERVKINKTIGRYKLLAAGTKWKEYMDDIRFALADLLVARGGEDDYKEALSYYNQIISKSTNLTIKGRALVGKAELVIAGTLRMDLDEAIKMCREGCKLIKGDLKEFFVAKCVAVEAELLVKKSGINNVNQAAKLFTKLIKKKNAHPYFRGRAMVGKAELILYFGVDSLSNGIKLCDDSIKLFISRPSDYFADKARIIQAELLSKRASPTDILKAETLCERVIASDAAHKDLQARAKLVLAEVSKKEKAKRLFEEVMDSDEIDPYIIEKAKLVEKSIKNRVN